ncbi:MAG TPA: hypothetical protein VE398_24265 [Acidobacteriota bacterium]|nr:hypothetical protein [Acidobacteriota bacterium]
MISYILAYKRQLRKNVPVGRAGSAIDPAIKSPAARLFHHLFLRSPRERATYCFTVKTLVRSQTHRTYFGAYLGVGLAFVVMGLVTLFTRHGFEAVFAVRSELLSIPLVLGFFVLLGLRVVFSLPAYLPSNWIFRLTDGNNLSVCLSGVRKSMIALGLLPLLGLAFPFYLKVWGWQTAAVHTAYCATLSLILIEVLLLRFDRIPFTCTYTPGSANLKLLWPVYLFGFTNYAYTMTELEQVLLRRPPLFILFFCASLVLLLAMSACRKRQIRRLSAFRYEAESAPAPEILTLSYKPY